MSRTGETICERLLDAWRNAPPSPDAPLPTETQLAAQFGVGRSGVHRALDILKGAGVLISRRHAGTFPARCFTPEELQRFRCRFLRRTAVLYPRSHYSFHWGEETIQGLEQRLAASGRELLRLPGENASFWQTFPALLAEAEKNDVGSVVVLPDHLGKELERLRPLLLNSTLPVFFYNYAGAPLALPGISTVTLDNYADGRLAGRLLARNQVRHIAMIVSDIDYPWSSERYRGLCDGIAELAPETARPEKIVADEGFELLLEKFIRRHSPDPMIVPAHCDFAASAESRLRKYGLECGVDYRLLTFMDNPYFRDRGYSALAVPMRRIGELFGELIAASPPFGGLPDAVHCSVASAPVQRRSFRWNASPDNMFV